MSVSVAIELCMLMLGSGAWQVSGCYILWRCGMWDQLANIFICDFGLSVSQDDGLINMRCESVNALAFMILLWLQ
jgi:hypothetical protein